MDTTGNVQIENKKQPTGMLGFTVIWVGQLFSLLGTQMTGFAITIWAWQITGQATALALVGFFGFVPVVLVSPIAGAIVDRHDRKKIMMLADFAAGLPTVAVLLLYLTGNLQIWHLYITGATAATFQAFHFPAYSAAISMMVRKEQYGRASGMLATAQFATGIFAPIAAALFLTIIGLPGVLLIDIATFLAAISMLFFIRIPNPPITEAGRRGTGSIWKESLYGFRYIRERPSLLGLQLCFFFSNLAYSFGNILLAPMILARTSENSVLLGGVMTAGGIGGVAGSILLTAWGGPKRRVHGVLLGLASSSVFGLVMMGLGRGFYVWAAASFLSLFIIPIINGSNQAIWQSKVAPDVQGRVFATRLLIAQISVPFSFLAAGPLADRVFEPAMRQGGSLVPLFGGLVGSGAGAGMGLMLVIVGVFGSFAGLCGYAFHSVRNAEDILPDHDATATASDHSTA
jgi:MFS family permease